MMNQDDAKDLADLVWVAFVQIGIVLLLISPGVWFVGSGYAIAAQMYVLLCIVIDDLPLITAARLNTAVAIGNVLLTVLVWRSTGTLSASVSAAYRCAMVSAVGVAMVVSSESVLRVAEHRRKGEGEDDSKGEGEGEDEDGSEETLIGAKGRTRAEAHVKELEAIAAEIHADAATRQAEGALQAPDTGESGTLSVADSSPANAISFY